MKRILQPIEAHGEQPLLVIKAGGMFESSILLLDDVRDKRKLGISGEIVVAVPARDTLLVDDRASEMAMKQIREVASKMCRTAAHRLTDQLFVRKESRFELFSGALPQT